MSDGSLAPVQSSSKLIGRLEAISLFMSPWFSRGTHGTEHNTLNVAMPDEDSSIGQHRCEEIRSRSGPLVQSDNKTHKIPINCAESRKPSRQTFVWSRDRSAFERGPPLLTWVRWARSQSCPPPNSSSSYPAMYFALPSSTT